MRINKIKDNDIANGKGIVVSLWTQGCLTFCKGCHNKDTWDYEQGKRFEQKDLDHILKLLDDKEINRNLSILGGEPLEYFNYDGILKICRIVKNKYPNKKIWLWTSFLYEDLSMDFSRSDILNYIDVLIDGKYIEDKKDLTLKYCGSTNQRVIDIKKTKTLNKIIKYIE